MLTGGDSLSARGYAHPFEVETPDARLENRRKSFRGRPLLQGLQGAKCLLGLLDWNKNVVMERTGHHIATDARLTEGAGESSGQTDCPKVGMNRQGYPRDTQQNGKPCIDGLLFGNNDRDALGFDNRRHGRQGIDVGAMGKHAIDVTVRPRPSLPYVDRTCSL